jgi:anaerobic selenocysteine-containing dehydrogenase
MKNYVICQQKAVEPQPDCLDEKQILVDLAAKMGIAGYWKSVKETLDYRLEPIGMKFEEFKKIGKYSVPLTYKSYEKNGMFRTPSGKVELYADYLKGLKISPLPNYSEPAESPLSSPDLLKDYPLILTTGGRNVVYYHSSYRNIPSLKKLSPDPELQINPQTAKELKVENGEWVYLASPRGRIRIKTCYFEDIDPRVVHSPHGYWYGVENGWETLNINILTDDASLCPVTASVPIKALLCRVEKIQ